MAEKLHVFALHHGQVALDIVQGILEVVHELVCEHLLCVPASRECEEGVEISDAEDEMSLIIGFGECPLV
jgi:hypothetical protein